jgi:multiple sugar transport system permease protein
MVLLKAGNYRSAIFNYAIIVALFAVLCFAILPIVWLILLSFKDIRHIFSGTHFFEFTLTNYSNVFGIRQGFAEEWTPASSIFPNFLNSLLAVLPSTAICIILGSLAGYGLGRFSFKRSKDLSFFILSLKMTPPIVAVIAFYNILRNLRLLDTVYGMMWVYTAFNLPFSIWMLRSGVQDIPSELDEAARIDGCTWWGAFRRVDFPLMMPKIAATVMMCIIFAWNEYLFAVTLTSGRAATITVAVSNFITQVQVEWGSLCAASVVASSAILILGFFIQRNIVEGLTFGAVKQ